MPLLGVEQYIYVVYLNTIFVLLDLQFSVICKIIMRT